MITREYLESNYNRVSHITEDITYVPGPGFIHVTCPMPNPRLPQKRLNRHIFRESWIGHSTTCERCNEDFPFLKLLLRSMFPHE